LVIRPPRRRFLDGILKDIDSRAPCNDGV